MVDLKFCPFCGGTAQLCATDAGGRYATSDLRKGVMIRGLLMTHRIIRCMKCGARTKVYATDRGAFNAWNRRNDVWQVGMYGKLAKRLREAAISADSGNEISESLYRDILQAADAIEELQKVANTLLAKFEEEATTVIWEYSGNIDKSLDWLHKEVGKYKAQINGAEE